MLKLGKSWENRNKLATLSEILHSSCDVWSPLLQQVKTYFWGVLGFHCHGPQVQLMVGELKSHKPWGHCQKKKILSNYGCDSCGLYQMDFIKVINVGRVHRS